MLFLGGSSCVAVRQKEDYLFVAVVLVANTEVKKDLRRLVDCLIHQPDSGETVGRATRSNKVSAMFETRTKRCFANKCETAVLRAVAALGNGWQQISTRHSSPLGGWYRCCRGSNKVGQHARIGVAGRQSEAHTRDRELINCSPADR